MALFLEVQIPFWLGLHFQLQALWPHLLPADTRSACLHTEGPILSRCCDWRFRCSVMVVSQHPLADGNSSQLCHPCHLLPSHKFPLHHDIKMLFIIVIHAPICHSDRLIFLVRGSYWIVSSDLWKGNYFYPSFFWTKWLLIKTFFPFILSFHYPPGNQIKHYLPTGYLYRE